MAKRTRGTVEELVQLPEGLDVPGPEEAGALPDEPTAIARATLEVIEAARIRQDPRRQVKWLLEFETVKIAPLKQPARMKLCRQARDRFVPGYPIPQPRNLEDLQRGLQDGLNTMRGDAPWEIEFDAKPKAVLWPPPRGRRSPKEGGAQLVWMPVRRFHDRFVVAAMQALDAAGSMLRLCQTPGCQKLFLATTRQARCRKHAAEAQQALLAAFTEKRREARRLKREARARRRARFRVAGR